MYCCREEGELPVLTLELSDLPTTLPNLGNRFLIQVGSSLTLSSPSLNLATWTRSVLHSASFFKVRPNFYLIFSDFFSIIQNILINAFRTFSSRTSDLKSDRVHLGEPASPIECQLYLPNVRAIQYKLGPERLTRLGNSNVLGLPMSLKGIESLP